MTKSVDTAIDQALNLYNEGLISEAEHLALKTLTEFKTLSDYQKYRLYRLLAFCSIAADDEVSGSRHFVEALKNNPGMTPDRLTWSPKVRRAFDRAKEIYQQQVTLERLRRNAIEAEIGRRASLKSLYFPGAGQVMKGQHLKGYSLGILFWATAAGFIYSGTVLPQARDRYLEAATSSSAEKRWAEYRDTQYLVNVTGIAALAVYGYIFFDALWSEPTHQDSLIIR